MQHTLIHITILTFFKNVFVKKRYNEVFQGAYILRIREKTFSLISSS